MELSLWQILVLAVVQGVTEFLPISSDGHLAVVSEFLAPGQDLDKFVEVNIVLHLGTLGSILVYYFRRIMRLLGEDRRLIGLIILGTIPAVVVGLPLHKFGKHILGDPLLAGLMLPVTGLLLIVASRFQNGKQDYRDITWRQALLIGCAQVFALLPGISRSGTTISSGVALGLSPKSATTFSFLLALPAIAGAGVLEMIEIAGSEGGGQTPVPWLIAGAVTSFVVGLAAVSLLVRVVEKQRLHWFAYWVIPFGIAVVIWQLLR
jgi:undecaprenyl-diphosphatase